MPVADDNEESMRLLSERDLLTGIYNRRRFCARTAEMLAERRDVHFVLVTFNIDRFRMVNDLFGMGTGDSLLISISESLKKALAVPGMPATYGRLGGDSFVFCMPSDLFDPEITVNDLDKVFEHFSIQYHISSHFGCYEVEDTNLPVEQMCDRANLALRDIKGKYHERYAYYDEQVRTKTLLDEQLAGEMDTALESHQFVCYFQPVFRTSTRELSSAEALVRWKHPQRGIIPPGQFVPLFEENGFITALDLYMWEEVCKYLRRSLDSGKSVVPISTNMSRIDMYDPKLCETITSLVEKYSLDTALLRFEITESAYTDNPEQLKSVIDDLRRAGFKFLMDDFGSGYSSLNLLKDLPIDVLKIDRAFIETIGTGEKSGNVLSSLIRLARGLRIPTVAEGVETEEQFNYLRGVGCDNIQGYYFSKPLPPEEFDTLLSTAKTSPTNTVTPTKGIGDFDGTSEDDDKKIVLVVDDQQINREILKNILSNNYHIIEAGNGREALDLLRSGRYDVELVLLDIVMPVMNGYDFLEEARYDPEFKSLPIIVMTEAGNSEAEVMALEYGASDYLKKPYDHATIRLRVNNLLELRELTAERGDVDSILNNLPGGIIVMEVGREMSVRYVSEALANLCGYTRDEYIRRFGQHPLDAIYPDDRERYENAYRTHSQNQGDTDIQYRVMLSSGAVRWHSRRDRFVSRKGSTSVYYGIIYDITEQRELDHRLQLQTERYRILAEHTSAITLDYDPIEDVMSYDVFREGQEPRHVEIRDCLSAYIKSSDLIERGSLRGFIDAIEHASSHATQGTYDCQHNMLGIGYRWGRMHYVSVADDTGQVYRVVGRLDDITEQKDHENELTTLAEKDPLTGLLNRTTAEKRINAILASDAGLRNDSFMIFDLDNFKAINDFHGHIMGDRVITELAKIFHKAFRDDDIICRLGGDEFIVFCRGISQPDKLAQRFDMLKQMTENVGADEHIGHVSLSAGIVVVGDNDTFETLYHKADQALYEAKDTGRSKFVLKPRS